MASRAPCKVPSRRVSHALGTKNWPEIGGVCGQNVRFIDVASALAWRHGRSHFRPGRVRYDLSALPRLPCSGKITTTLLAAVGGAGADARRAPGRGRPDEEGAEPAGGGDLGGLPPPAAGWRAKAGDGFAGRAWCWTGRPQSRAVLRDTTRVPAGAQARTMRGVLRSLAASRRRPVPPVRRVQTAWGRPRGDGRGAATSACPPPPSTPHGNANSALPSRRWLPTVRGGRVPSRSRAGERPPARTLHRLGEHAPDARSGGGRAHRHARGRLARGSATGANPLRSGGQTRGALYSSVPPLRGLPAGALHQP